MLDFARRHRVLLAALGCLALAAVLLGSTATGRTGADPLGRLLADVVSPFQRLSRVATGGLGGLWRGVAGLFRGRAEFERLESQVAALEVQTVHVTELEQENERLRDLLQFRERFAGDMLAAVVIGRDATGLSRTLTIDRGERDGVAKGAAVLAPQGVVGRVFFTSDRVSRVLLINDHNSALDAIVQRTRARGIVEGTVAEGCGLKFVKRTEDLQQGDVIVTSGVDGIFPRGLPVGVITTVDKRGQGLFQYAAVRPFVDSDRLEEVLLTRGTVEPMLGEAPMSAPLE